MLNTVGQGLTNHFQHAAVDNTRLHIPLLFGADVIHGFRTIFPVPLATTSSWDPDLITCGSTVTDSHQRTARLIICIRYRTLSAFGPTATH